LAAAEALHVPAISSIVNAIVLWLPQLFVALLVLIIGALLARVVGDLVRAATDAADISGGPLFAAIARYAVLALAVIIALNQIGVGAAIVQVLFASVMFGLTLALALAFGLGGRETAKDIVDSWYTSTRRRRTISAEETGRAAPSRTREDARTRPSAQEPVS
ncbi:MAG: mechanosensitive ion channel family protein, partial [Ktedonobacterales bacterium]